MRAVRIVLITILLLMITSHTAAHAQTTDRLRAEKLFVEAQKALSQSDSERAESLLKKALEEDPTFTSSIWQLAQIYEKRGKLEHARELLIRGLQQEPQAVWAKDKLAQLEAELTRKLLAQAKSYMQSGQYELAIPKLSLYLGIKPYDPIPLVMIGRCHLALGSLDSAKEYFEQAIGRDPSNIDAQKLLVEVEKRLASSRTDDLVQRARAILDSYAPERKDEAIDALLAVLAADPQNQWAKQKIAELDTPDAGPAPAFTLDADDRSKARGPLLGTPDFILYALAGCLVALVVCVVLLFRQRSKKAEYPLSGTLALIPILDVVALVHSNLRSGKLVIAAPKGKGEIIFQKGEIIHARWKGMDGKKAFARIMEQRTGRYFFSSRISNRRQTIDEPLSVLLLSMNRNDGKSEPQIVASESEKLITTP
jgi:tetratricopeptide (TPR) repeat protein